MSIAELLGHDDIEIVTAGTGAEALDDAAASSRATASCSTCGCPTCRASRCWSRSATTRRCADVPVVVFTGRELSPRRTRSCTRWRAASWSRASSRPSGCSTRPRCSCTAWSPTCRPRSSGCSSGCTARTRTWSARTVLLVDDDVRNIFALSQRARAARHEGAHRDHRQRGDRAGRDDARPRDRADGHHDAGDGRLSDDRR